MVKKIVFLIIMVIFVLYSCTNGDNEKTSHSEHISSSTESVSESFSKEEPQSSISTNESSVEESVITQLETYMIDFVSLTNWDNSEEISNYKINEMFLSLKIIDLKHEVHTESDRLLSMFVAFKGDIAVNGRINYSPQTTFLPDKDFFCKLPIDSERNVVNNFLIIRNYESVLQYLQKNVYNGISPADLNKGDENSDSIFFECEVVLTDYQFMYRDESISGCSAEILSINGVNII